MGDTMQTLYVMSTNFVSEQLDKTLWPYCHLVLDGSDVVKDDARTIELVKAEASGYQLEPEFASLPDATRRHILFGRMFEEDWTRSDVYLVMIKDGAIAWVARY